MTTARFVRIAAILLALIALTSQAFASTSGFDTPREAAEGHRRVSNYHRDLKDDGFTLKDVQEQSIKYFVAPKAPYLWGNLVFVFTRPAAKGSLMVDYVEVSVSIRYTDDGFKFASMSTNEYTAH